MSNRGRDKQVSIEARLQSLGSKAYGNINAKLKNGTYRKNRDALRNAAVLLEKQRNAITRRLVTGTSKQVRGNQGKLDKIEALLDMMGEETDVENSSEAVLTRCIRDSKKNFSLKHNVKTDGDCFYSSLFKAACWHGAKSIVGNVQAAFGLAEDPVLDEETFLSEIRARVADLIRGGIYLEMRDANLEDIRVRQNFESEEGRRLQIEQTRSLFEELWYSAMSSIASANSATSNAFSVASNASSKASSAAASFDENFNAFDTWLKESCNEIQEFIGTNLEFLGKYPDVTLENEMRFYNDMAEIITIQKTYASQTDIEVVKYVLNKNSIVLEIHSSKKLPKCSFYSEIIPVLWFFRKKDGQHYEYFSRDKSGKNATARRRVCG